MTCVLVLDLECLEVQEIAGLVTQGLVVLVVKGNPDLAALEGIRVGLVELPTVILEDPALVARGDSVRRPDQIAQVILAALVQVVQVGVALVDLAT